MSHTAALRFDAAPSPGVAYIATHWTAVLFPGRVRWTGPRTGVSWDISVDFDRQSLRPRITTLRATPPNDRTLTGIDLGEIEAAAIAHATRWAPERDAEHFPVVDLISARPRSWRYYVREMQAPSTRAEYRGTRRESRDYRKVAEVYLRAAERGDNPHAAIEGAFGVSDVYARQLKVRAIEAGWLSPPERPRGISGPGARLR